MQTEEQRIIEGLFSRLQQAEAGSGPRDADAQRLIQACLTKQPAAPYYMAQAMLIQEAALKRLNQQVEQLQQQISQLQSQPRSSGGFLAGLFGGGSQSGDAPASAAPTAARTPLGSQPIPGAANYAQPGYGQPAPSYGQQPTAAPSRAGSFLGGALQTAAGVAGGMVMANMLTGLFHQSRPEEIVNIIEDTPAPEATNSDVDRGNETLGNDAQNTDAQDNGQNDADWRQDNSGGFGQDSGFSDPQDDGFFGGDDDDSSFF
ncbi:DUF2076 domain-containing protein [Edwardsiella anguillarum]|uniref:DUF2076 domain-containing protein n=1 Tax=Edwardsiella anguillarum TaxID=1821960 RepID=UPI0024B765AE|nr:DUF2076 domain-containing protein [Edwardsiella anguillarum]WHP80944.1 DUF2076 domain-containing protein [Edwardsiella anguillarum]WHQ18446.1 DUF2076 domain-containing protein [Edwardsiella anguillarum]WHQ21985.1 DUF2076 domain-containing protein [Edwardsiella anguillarum]WHQ25509.1 DUF2076 domain-containing protein [Edwardsiella anguillarum]WHQ29031.1 DUF2076 domain-containing protein [Edwardsiella anguillarum]